MCVYNRTGDIADDKFSKTASTALSHAHRVPLQGIVHIMYVHVHTYVYMYSCTVVYLSMFLMHVHSCVYGIYIHTYIHSQYSHVSMVTCPLFYFFVGWPQHILLCF